MSTTVYLGNYWKKELAVQVGGLHQHLKDGRFVRHLLHDTQDINVVLHPGKDPDDDFGVMLLLNEGPDDVLVETASGDEALPNVYSLKPGRFAEIEINTTATIKEVKVERGENGLRKDGVFTGVIDED
jgi:hypothetical protein